MLSGQRLGREMSFAPYARLGQMAGSHGFNFTQALYIRMCICSCAETSVHMQAFMHGQTHRKTCSSPPFPGYAACCRSGCASSPYDMRCISSSYTKSSLRICIGITCCIALLPAGAVGCLKESCQESHLHAILQLPIIDCCGVSCRTSKFSGDCQGTRAPCSSSRPHAAQANAHLLRKHGLQGSRQSSLACHVCKHQPDVEAVMTWHRALPQTCLMSTVLLHWAGRCD